MKTTPLLAITLAVLVLRCNSAPPDAEVPKVNYVFNAKVVRVIDGAHVALDVDLGFHMWLHNQTFLLQDVKAPAFDDPNQAAVMAAKTRVQELLKADDEVVLQSIRDKTDKSGTYHAVLWKDGESINAKLGAK